MFNAILDNLGSFFRLSENSIKSYQKTFVEGKIMTIYTHTETVARKDCYIAREEFYSTLKTNGLVNVKKWYIGRLDKDMQVHIIREYSSKYSMLRAFNRDYC